MSTEGRCVETPQVRIWLLGATAPCPWLIRGSIAHRDRYRQQPLRRRQVSEGRLLLIVDLVANLARIVARGAVLLVSSLAGVHRCLSGIGRSATVKTGGGGGQYCNGQKPLHQAVDHCPADNLADCTIASIRNAARARLPAR